MELEYIDDVSDHTWEKFISNNPCSYFFHTPAWAKIMGQTYGYRIATRLYTINGNKILIPMMTTEKYGLRSFYSTPFGYGNIFSTGKDVSDEIPLILNDIVKERQLFFNLYLPPFSSLSLKKEHLTNDLSCTIDSAHIFSLEKGFDYIWKEKMKKVTKKAVRKAEKSDLITLKGHSVEDFKTFYHLYAASSKRWGYFKPPEPLALYQNMYRYGGSNIRLYLSYKDDLPIAGLVSLAFGRNIFVWKTSFLKEYGPLRAVNLLVKESLEDACKEGYKYYNLGSSANIEGVIRFKESFGADVVGLKRYTVMTRLGKAIRDTMAINSNLRRIVTAMPEEVLKHATIPAE